MYAPQVTKLCIHGRDLLGYLGSDDIRPLFIHGEALQILTTFPNESIDCCMTSPPYWGQRQYAVTGIGLETDYREYISNLVKVFAEVKRVLKSTGSLWLNLGDTYQNNSSEYLGVLLSSSPINKVGFYGMM